MIWFFKPYSMERDIGVAYNQYCSQVPNDNDWICLMDGDSMFLNSDYGHVIQTYIDKYPECALFIPTTNRVGATYQCYNNIRSENDSIRHHRRISKQLNGDYTIKDLSLFKVTMPCYIFKKALWNKVKFDTTGNILGIDIRFSEAIKPYGKTYRMNGLYLLHYYRLLEGKNYKGHIITEKHTVR
jgi:hypothetical protein